jgi:cell division transport system ATP-binding protein
MATTERHVRQAGARPQGPAVISFENVSKRYPSGDTGLENVSFDVRPGEFVFIVGASGSGKSTTMRLLIKEVEPTGGTINVAGHDLAQITRRKVPYYRRNLGVVFQDYKLLPNRTVYENVAYALQVTGGTRREIREKVPDILRLTGLSLKLHSHPDQLSGGEQQRVSVARAFVNHPPLLLADEPTGNLDPETSIGIMQLLYRINKTGTTVVVATHDVDMVDRMRRRVIELSGGRVVRDERVGAYAARESTTEFAVRLREDDQA